MNKVLRGCVWLLLWPHGRMLVYPSDTRDRPGGGIRQTSISLDKLLDRVVQHAELIYRVSEESCLQFEENFIPLSVQIQGGDLCLTKAFAIPGSKGEIQQTSDRWLLNSVLILIQSWIEPLVNLQTTLDRYDNAPISLLNKTKWVSHKLTSLEQGVLVIMRMILGEGTSIPEHLQRLADNNKQPEQAESVLRDYALLTCFKKDAHKIDTFLKLLKCRQTNKTSCFLP